MMIKTERHANQCAPVMKANTKGIINANAKVVRYSTRAKPGPKRTANVFLQLFCQLVRHVNY